MAHKGRAIGMRWQENNQGGGEARVKIGLYIFYEQSAFAAEVQRNDLLSYKLFREDK